MVKVAGRSKAKAVAKSSSQTPPGLKRPRSEDASSTDSSVENTNVPAGIETMAQSAIEATVSAISRMEEVHKSNMAEFQNAQKLMVEELKTKVTDIQNAQKTNMEEIQSTQKSSLLEIQNAQKVIMEDYKASMATSKKAYDESIEKIKELAKRASDSKEQQQSFIDEIKTTMDDMMECMRRLGENPNWRTLGNIENTLKEVKDAQATFMNNVRDQIADAQNEINTTTEGFFDTLGEWLNGYFVDRVE